MVFDEKAQFLYTCLLLLHLTTFKFEVEAMLWSKHLGFNKVPFGAGVGIPHLTFRSLWA